MKNSTAANAAFATAAALVASIAAVKTDPAPDYSKADLLAPAQVEVGELVTLSAQGNDVNWSIHPDVPIQAFGEQDSSLATAFQRPGDYLVISSWLDDSGEVQLRKQPILVIPYGEPTLAPELPPIIEVDGAAPVVRPEPTPDHYANTAFPEVSDSVVTICGETAADRPTCCTLAKNFTTIADKIDAGHYQTVAAVLRDTQALNKPIIKINRTTTKIQLLVSRKRFDGSLGDVAAYADLWHQISAGLKQYGECE